MLVRIKKYLARFKVYNGECTYTIICKTNAENLTKATSYFKTYEIEENDQIWQLRDVTEVKTFQEVWDYV